MEQPHSTLPLPVITTKTLGRTHKTIIREVWKGNDNGQMEGGLTLKGRWTRPGVSGCFFPSMSPSSDLGKVKSQTDQQSRREKYDKKSSFYGQRTSKEGPVEQTEWGKPALFSFSLCLVPGKCPRTVLPWELQQQPWSHLKILLSDHMNEKAGGNHGCFFLSLFPLAASPWSQTQSWEMHNSTERLNSHLSSLRTRKREPKDLGSVGGVMKRMEFWEMDGKKMWIKFYIHFWTVHIWNWPQTAYQRFWEMNLGPDYRSGPKLVPKRNIHAAGQNSTANIWKLNSYPEDFSGRQNYSVWYYNGWYISLYICQNP